MQLRYNIFPILIGTGTLQGPNIPLSSLLVGKTDKKEQFFELTQLAYMAPLLLSSALNLRVYIRAKLTAVNAISDLVSSFR